VIKSFESQSIEIIRLLYLAGARSEIRKIDISVSPEVAGFLQNQKRATLAKLEEGSNCQITVNADQNCVGENSQINCYDQRGSVVKF
jgi:Ribonuclease G/E